MKNFCLYVFVKEFNMKQFKIFILISLVLLLSSCQQNCPVNCPYRSDKCPMEEGWVQLFNGKNLDGWKQINGKATYEVDNGTILGTTVKGSPNSFLCPKKKYSDFELKFEVKVDSRLNSGCQVRSHSKEDVMNGRLYGPQVEISTDGMAGFIWDEARRSRWLNSQKQREEKKKLNIFKNDQWNSYYIVCKGDHYQTWVNGKQISDLRDDMDKKGYIGLQVHSFKGDPPAQVRWRNIWIKEL